MAWYASEFGVPDAPVIDSRVSVLADAFGLAHEHFFPIAALELPGQSFIETDQLPAEATARPVIPGQLPPGIAMMSFECGSPLDDPTYVGDGPPYYGAGMRMYVGPGGEMVEVIGR